MDALIQTQRHGLNLSALATVAQQYTTAHNKHAASTLKPITMRKGAEVGAVGLAALGLMFQGLPGLFTGGLIGAAAGAAIVALLRDKKPPVPLTQTSHRA
jgi:hypothetical protein